MTKLKNHPLIDQSKPRGLITFVHPRVGRATFWVATNEMTGDRLSAFGSDPPYINMPIPEIKAIFRNIRGQAMAIISYEGTKEFAAKGR